MNIPQFENNFYFLLAAVCYYFYNDRMFSYIDSITGRKLPKWESRVITYIINYGIFILISNLNFYLIINWTIFAVFLVAEIRVLYKVSMTMSLFCGIQGAMVGLAINFITRSGASLLTDQPLLAFDSHASGQSLNLKAYPISAGFILSGLAFWRMQRRFKGWAQQEANPSKPVNLIFSLSLVSSLFIYLDLNLLIYFTPGNATILKLWGMKSGICVLVGYYIGISHIYTLSKLLHFERQSYDVRKELVTHIMQEERLEKLAFHDTLTGCSSREAARKAMEEYYAGG